MPSRPAPYQQARPQQNPPFSQPAQPSSTLGSGGFMRNLAGGLAGGILGSMLFRSLGFGGTPGVGMGGGGIGFLEIVMMGGLLFLLFRLFQSRRSYPSQSYSAPINPAAEPIFTAAFDPVRFKETAQDIFFKVQGAWTRGDLDLVKTRVSSETLGLLQQDMDSLKSRREINRLENIAVREMDITEAWQEAGADYITVRFLANLLDYNTDEAGKVISGSDADPVKFEEYWTFLRASGPAGPWMLSAIQQGTP
jgi:predicted lipid-binding transport protein (Tim44 family)